MIGTLMSALDQSIVNVSLPEIMADFGSTIEDIEWVITGYMLAFATLMPLTAWLREHIGYKKLFLASLLVFTGGSLLCGLAWNLPALVAARVIQALGGGAITPTGMAMITEVFEPKERGKAIGYWAVGVIVGPAFGPTLGGYLTHVFGWRSIFTINLPIGIIGVLLAITLLKEDKPSTAYKHPFDLWGFLFLSTFLVALLLGLSKGEDKGWDSNYILTCWALAVTGFIGFLVVEKATPNGIMDVRLLKQPIYSACMLVVSARSLALFGGTFLLPIFLQNMMGFDEIQSGLILLPGALLIAVLMPLASKLADRTGPLLPSLVGLILIAYFMYAYRDLDVNTSLWGVIAPTLIRGLGIALLITPVMVTALNSIPKHKAGMASSMLNLCQQVAGSIGIGILGAVLSHRTVFHQGLVASVWDPTSPATAQTVGQVADRLQSLGVSPDMVHTGALFTVMGHIYKMAAVAGFEDSFLVGMAIVLLAIIPAMFLPTRNVHHQGDPDSVAVAD
jgi:DHA2 family multidrug resistance protein